MTTANIYEIRIFGMFYRLYQTRAMVATALGVTDAALQALVDANVAAGRAPYPISATGVSVAFSGILNAVNMPATAEVQVNTVPVVTSYP